MMPIWRLYSFDVGINECGAVAGKRIDRGN
jgi:hypothetical protein